LTFKTAPVVITTEFVSLEERSGMFALSDVRTEGDILLLLRPCHALGISLDLSLFVFVVECSGMFALSDVRTKRDIRLCCCCFALLCFAFYFYIFFYALGISLGLSLIHSRVIIVVERLAYERRNSIVLLLLIPDALMSCCII
jgi:hypothetical protein